MFSPNGFEYGVSFFFLQPNLLSRYFMKMSEGSVWSWRKTPVPETHDLTRSVDRRGKHKPGGLSKRVSVAGGSGKSGTHPPPNTWFRGTGGLPLPLLYRVCAVKVSRWSQALHYCSTSRCLPARLENSSPLDKRAHAGWCAHTQGDTSFTLGHPCPREMLITEYEWLHNVSAVTKLKERVWQHGLIFIKVKMNLAGKFASGSSRFPCSPSVWASACYTGKTEMTLLGGGYLPRLHIPFYVARSLCYRMMGSI